MPFRLIFTLSLLLAACSAPTDPLDAIIQARTSTSFQYWLTRHEAELPAADRKEFADALQELRFELMDNFRLLDSAQVNQALRQEIDGQPVRAMLIRAWRRKHARLVEERALLRSVVELNVDGQPLNSETAHVLADTMQRHVSHLDRIETEITWLEDRLRQLGAPVSPPTPTPPDHPAPLSPSRGSSGVA